ncbi:MULTISPECIES: Panacea domain-containing protein [unclassified Saccharothrix]|uniref:Panacea domain-containing protein n=1 Tax=unclassified Saccharothrix TaxID=2593673 RepID=UPI00307D6A99
MARYSALVIAKWFLAWAEEVEQAYLTNLKLQKLLYYAQGHHLAWAGAPLFKEELQAWSHGPVVPEVYRAFRDFGGDPIRLPDEDSFSWDDVDEGTAQFLMKVWNTYGGYAAWRLRNMTHDEPPWKEHFVEDERNLVIPEAAMKRHFDTVTKVS